MDLDILERILDHVCESNSRSDADLSLSTERNMKRSLCQSNIDSESVSLSNVKRKKAPTASEGVFLTNLPQSADQRGIRDWVSRTACVPETVINRIEIGLDKLNRSKSAGWCVITTKMPELAEKLNYQIFGDRCVYASLMNRSESDLAPFRLPEDIISRLRQLLDERALNDSPAGRLADAYRRNFGVKVPFEIYGFRNFQQAISSIPGVRVYDKDGCLYLRWD